MTRQKRSRRSGSKARRRRKTFLERFSFGNHAQQKKHRPQPQLRRPLIEPLEQRRVLSMGSLIEAELAPFPDAVECDTHRAAGGGDPSQVNGKEIDALAEADGDLVLGEGATTLVPKEMGLELVDPDTSQMAGQIFYLDFDGATGVSYDGPVTVDNLNIPPFEIPSFFPDATRDTVITETVQQLNSAFEQYDVSFTTTPPAEHEYSTIYVGGDDSRFAEYGSFLGLAEQVDVGNLNRNDEAIVFSASLPLDVAQC